MIGIYRDKSETDLTNSTQTTIVSEVPDIARVNKDSTITPISPGETSIIVDGKVTIPVTVRFGKR